MLARVWMAANGETPLSRRHTMRCDRPDTYMDPHTGEIGAFTLTDERMGLGYNPNQYRYYGPQILFVAVDEEIDTTNANNLIVQNVSKFCVNDWYPGVEVKPVFNTFDKTIIQITKNIPECSFDGIAMATTKWLPEKWKTQKRKICTDHWMDAWRQIVRHMQFNLDRMLNDIPIHIEFHDCGPHRQFVECTDGMGNFQVFDWTEMQKDYLIRQMGNEISKTSRQLKICLAYEHMRKAHGRLLRILHRLFQGQRCERDAVVAMIMMHWFLLEFPYYCI